ncbi:MAG TPA: hypothetical protein VFK76_06410 [Gaiellaceae bacterium]|nr:hypothetical protein [Gaiellaceae bacterium]
MTRDPEMRCPKCGSEMNHQARKVVPPVSDADVAALSETFDGILEDVFACPECGWVDARRVEAPPSVR